MTRKLRLAVEIAAAYLRARWLRARTDLPTALARLRTSDGATPLAGADARAVALPIARAARRMLDAIPADSRCLIRSLVLTRLLARRGVETKLVIAVCVDGGFGAHAWVELDERPLLEPASAPFQRLVEL